MAQTSAPWPPSPTIFRHPGQAPPGSMFTHWRGPVVSPWKFVVKRWLTKLNALLLFLPISVWAHVYDWSPELRLVFACLEIIPMAKLLGESVDVAAESVARGPPPDEGNIDWPEICSDLLQAVCGNAMEVTIGVCALLQDDNRLAQTFIFGSILTKILLGLGCVFMAGGFRYSESNFSTTAAQTGSSLMTLSSITLIIPAAYHARNPDPVGLLTISRAAAVLLLIVYAAFLFFQLRTHAYLFSPVEEESDDEQPPDPNFVLSDFKVGIPSAFALLGITSTAAALCSYFLVSAIEDAPTEELGLPPIFIHAIVLPLLVQCTQILSFFLTPPSEMAESVGLCVGGAIQLATLVLPLLVLLSWACGKAFTLFFVTFETITLSASVVLVTALITDGICNYLEGSMLLVLYCTVAFVMFIN
ncbi:hypothetical protein BD410DRAFT_785721 [Rickenella mellea]|uniref:Sodium/calcium exchanger membrane region domain-containing protein n=1 Tax=Rickenella mellea TaxID=50990 RepID=A0A4Y7QDM3_9AGAM|nr:hypothetical protein BD410DRAFT_785721 [Rickenella mellea]